MIISETYKDARSRMSARNDTNYCVPMALGILAGVDPVKVAEDMEASGLRRRGSGVRWPNIKTQANILNLNLVDITPLVLKCGAKSVASITSILNPSKSYLVGVRGHVLAIVDGIVHDWTNDKKNRPTEIYQVNGDDFGTLTVNTAVVLQDKKAQSLADEIATLSNSAIVKKSGAEARLIYWVNGARYSCYIRKSRAGYTLQYSLKTAYYEISPATSPTKTTSQYANYDFNTLQEAVTAADEAADARDWY